jgi:hypothetical protein
MTTTAHLPLSPASDRPHLVVLLIVTLAGQRPVERVNQVPVAVY